MTPDFETVLSKMEHLFQKLVGAERVPSYAGWNNFPRGRDYIFSQRLEKICMLAVAVEVCVNDLKVME